MLAAVHVERLCSCSPLHTLWAINGNAPGNETSCWFLRHSNLPFSSIKTVKEFLPSMLQHNRGHIVSIASIAGCVGLAGAVDYCSSKFAAVGLMASLRQELASQGKTGIQFTTVCPALINTGMFDGVRFR